MNETDDAEQSPDVDTERRARGRRIERRMHALRISARQFEERSHISRRTLQRALDGAEAVKESTYDHIESWLDRLERQAETFEGIPDVPSDEPPRFVELQMEGVFGVAKVVARGPVDDPDAVAKAAMALMRELRAEQGQEPKPAAGDEPDDK